MATTEAGHHSSRSYTDQDGNIHLNGSSLYLDEAGVNISTPAMVAGGSTLTVSKATHHGRDIALDTLAGTTITLPTASGSGARFRFLVTVTATSNSHIIKVGNGTDVMRGFINNHDQDGTTAAMYKAASTDDTITMNRTTTGGVIGDWVECVDMLSGYWWINGIIGCVAGSNVATPFSATVS